jgi:hypothetical protein
VSFPKRSCLVLDDYVLPHSLYFCLSIATQAAIGLADLHNIDSEGDASIAHTDISPNQYIKVRGIYKLNDFNRARFIPWSNKNKTACPYRIGSNPGKNRAPEEYKLEPQSEKVSSSMFSFYDSSRANFV